MDINPLARRWKTFVATGLLVAIVVQVVALTPSFLESGGDGYLDEDTLVDTIFQHPETLAPGIPQRRIPEYSVDEFNYVSIVEGAKEWKILASTAYLYNQEKLAHSRKVTAYLYDGANDTDADAIFVTGKEGKFYLNQRELEVFGSVRTVLKDGFVIFSEYIKYYPKTKTIEIPISYAVQGVGEEQDGKQMRFRSRGMDYRMSENRIYLPSNVEFTMETLPTEKDEDGEITVIESDHALIYRDKKLAHFTMSQARPLKDRFVRIKQETLFTRGRRADMNYGDFANVVNYLVAYEDVFIRELQIADAFKEKNDAPIQEEAPLRYATSGKAEFDKLKNLIVLTKLPQVYQDNDTITGDRIIFHRDSDLIEVEQSNAFSEGKSK